MIEMKHSRRILDLIRRNAGGQVYVFDRAVASSEAELLVQFHIIWLGTTCICQIQRSVEA